MRKVTVADLILPSAFGKNISLNTILAPGDRNLNKSILQSLFKSPEGCRGRGGGGMLKLRINRRINREELKFGLLLMKSRTTVLFIYHQTCHV